MFAHHLLPPPEVVSHRVELLLVCLSGRTIADVVLVGRPALVACVGSKAMMHSGRTAWHAGRTVRSGVLALKCGMMSMWDKWGRGVAVTVLEVQDCHVVQVKKEDTHGYGGCTLAHDETQCGCLDCWLT